MAQAYEKGLIKAVGVSNYGVDALRACHDALAKRGIPLASNQIQYSLLYRFPEQNGLLKACDELGVQVLAYSPLALGLLTGKYTTVEEVKNTVRGPRQQLFAQTVENPQFRSLLATMEDIAASHSTNDRTVNLPQVAINYCRSKGTIPIPGARNLRQVQSNYAALEWELTPMDVTKLDAASDGLAYIDPSASPFPKYDKDTGLKMFDS
jgi:pyridoxine 4-dehydrogenase